MALYEYFCKPCQEKFEQITSPGDVESGKCPKCQGNNTERLISRFAVGGQGDLREKMTDGCHSHDHSPNDPKHHH